MDDPYMRVKTGKLKLKNEKKVKRKKATSAIAAASSSKRVDTDADRHGGYWAVDCFAQIAGPVAIELRDMRYLHYDAADNNDIEFELAPSGIIGEGPDEKELFLVVKVSDNRIAFKTAYSTFLSCDQDGSLQARSHAIGVREQFEPVFEEGNLALAAANNKFLGTYGKDEVGFKSEKATCDNYIRIRSSLERVEANPIPEKERGTLKQTEENYVRMFQSFHHQRFKMNSNDRNEISQAKDDGRLRETLLDRRMKMKADKFC